MIRGSGRVGLPGGRRGWLQQAFVTAEVGLTLTLLIAAGLLVKSYDNLSNVEPGFVVGNLLTFRVSPLTRSRLQRPEELQAFYDDAFERVGNLSGVQTVAATTSPPFTEILNLAYFRFGMQESPELAESSWVSAGYFRTMQIPMLRGRDFEALDTRSDAQGVVIINQTMARRYWPDEEPIGKEIWLGKVPVEGPETRLIQSSALSGMCGTGA